MRTRLAARIAGALPVPVVKAVSRAQWRHPLVKRCFDWCAGLLRNQDGIIQHGVGKGLLFNVGSAHAGYLLGTSEPAVQSALKTLVRPGAVVYDIGSNVGFLAMIAARLVGPSGRVLAFEPLPENFERLKHNAGLNHFDNIQAFNLALADYDGAASFLTSRECTWGKLASVQGTVGAESGRREVNVACLDSIAERERLPAPDLIKIDVEGAEVEVLEGAKMTIQKSRPILMIELHGTNLAIANKLKNMDYCPVVLGGSKLIEDSPWDAYVIAFPEPCAAMNEIRELGLGTR